MKPEKSVMSNSYKVVLTKVAHYKDCAMGNAEGTIDGREFVASWYNKDQVGGILYDMWLDTTAAQNKAISSAIFSSCCDGDPCVTVRESQRKKRTASRRKE